jgi:hypothetical protein
MARHLQLLETLNAGYGLYERFIRGGVFRPYLMSRLQIALPAVLLIVVLALASTAAAVVFVGGMRSWLVLLALLAAPFLLLGNLAVQLYVFLSWLEIRAVARPGQAFAPPVPWLLAALFVLVPFCVLLFVSWPVALLLGLGMAAMPFAYARLDRAMPRPAAPLK